MRIQRQREAFAYEHRTKTAMPRQDAYDAGILKRNFGGHPDQAPPLPGPWFHGSPEKLEVGDILHPGTAKNYEYDDDWKPREGWVFMDLDPRRAKMWAGLAAQQRQMPHDAPTYVYHVEPLDEGPWPWNESPYMGYASPRARVVERRSTNDLGDWDQQPQYGPRRKRDISPERLQAQGRKKTAMPMPQPPKNTDAVKALETEFYDWWDQSGRELNDPKDSWNGERGPLGHWPYVEDFLKERYPVAWKGNETGLEQTGRQIDHDLGRGPGDEKYYHTGPQAVAQHGYDPAEIAATMLLLHSQTHPFRRDFDDQRRLTDIIERRERMRREYEADPTLLQRAMQQRSMMPPAARLASPADHNGQTTYLTEEDMDNLQWDWGKGRWVPRPSGEDRLVPAREERNFNYEGRWPGWERNASRRLAMPGYHEDGDDGHGHLDGKWQPGDIAHFEYHCNQSPNSPDYYLWRATQQPVKVTGLADCDDFSDEMPTYNERGDEGVPLVYKIQLPSGESGTAFEDELHTHPKHYQNVYDFHPRNRHDSESDTHYHPAMPGYGNSNPIKWDKKLERWVEHTAARLAQGAGRVTWGIWGLDDDTVGPVRLSKFEYINVPEEERGDWDDEDWENYHAEVDAGGLKPTKGEYPIVDQIHDEFSDWWDKGGTPGKNYDPDALDDGVKRGPIGHWPTVENFLKDRYPAAYRGLGYGWEEAKAVLDGEDIYRFPQGVTNYRGYETGQDAIDRHGYDPKEVASAMMYLHNLSRGIDGSYDHHRGEDGARLWNIFQKRLKMQRAVTAHLPDADLAGIRHRIQQQQKDASDKALINAAAALAYSRRVTTTTRHADASTDSGRSTPLSPHRDTDDVVYGLSWDFNDWAKKNNKTNPYDSDPDMLKWQKGHKRGPIGYWPNVEDYLKEHYPAAHRGLTMGYEEVQPWLDEEIYAPSPEKLYPTGPEAIAQYGYDPKEIVSALLLLHSGTHPFRGDDWIRRDQNRLWDIAQKRMKMQRDFDSRPKEANMYDPIAEARMALHLAASALDSGYDDGPYLSVWDDDDNDDDDDDVPARKRSAAKTWDETNLDLDELYDHFNQFVLDKQPINPDTGQPHTPETALKNWLTGVVPYIQTFHPSLPTERYQFEPHTRSLDDFQDVPDTIFKLIALHTREKYGKTTFYNLWKKHELQQMADTWTRNLETEFGKGNGIRPDGTFGPLKTSAAMIMLGRHMLAYRGAR